MDAAAYRRAEGEVWASLGVEPAEHFVDLPRHGVRVRLLEVGEGPPALFVHGTSVAGSTWADLVARLPDRRCLVLDRPGCGLSEPVELDGTVEALNRHADDLVADVLDALGLDAVDVVSTSMGGYFALRGAAAHPERVRRIVHHGWSMGAPVARLPLVMRAAVVPGVSRVMATLPVNAAGVRAMLRQVGLAGALDAGRVSDEAIRYQVALNNHTDTRRNEYRLVRGASLPRLIEQTVLPRSLLADVVAPTRIVFGVQDPFGTPTTMGALVDALPDAELVLLQDAGHAVWLDDPDRVAGLTSEHLA